MKKDFRLALFVSGALLLIVYVVSAIASGPRCFCPPAPDSFLYAQAARQIANGQPFVFTPSDDISTGTTGHLYPFLLAPAFVFGASGSGSFLYGFLLNSIFYLLFVAAWVVIVRRVSDDEHVRLVGTLMIALSGQTLSVATGQTDTGLFMVVSAWMFAALLADRRVLFGILLSISPWCRPEGTILSFLFLFAIVIRRFWGDRPRSSEWLIAVLAVFSSISVFLFNYLLTGVAQYQSVLYKGCFTRLPLWAALPTFAASLVDAFQSILFGVGGHAVRKYLFVPILGGIASLFGLLRFRWKEEKDLSWKLLWFVFAQLTTIALVASSGYQETNLDRYLGWVFPSFFLFTSIGIFGIKTKNFKPCSTVLASVFILFQLGMTICYFLPTVYRNTLRLSLEWTQHEELAEALPDNVLLGFVGENVVPFLYSERHPDSRFGMYNLHGIYSPRFLVYPPIMNLETLKHERDLRFDYWLFDHDAREFWDADVSILTGEQLFQCFDGNQAVAADWSVFDSSNVFFPFDTNCWELVDSVDVGYQKDEDSHRYSIFNRISGYQFDLLAMVLSNQTERIPEIGRVVMGGDSMVVNTRVGQPLRIVMRTTRKASFWFRSTHGSGEKTLLLTDPLKIRVLANGKELDLFQIPLSSNDGDAIHVVMDIPAEYINSPTTKVELFGDHFAFAYWFLSPRKEPHE